MAKNKNIDENNNTNLKSKRLASTDGSLGFPSCLWQRSSSWFWTWHSELWNYLFWKRGRAPLPPGGAAAIDEEVDRGVDPQEKVVRTCQAEKIGWRREKPEKERKWEKNLIENLPHLIRFSTMKSSPMMRMTLGKLKIITIIIMTTLAHDRWRAPPRRRTTRGQGSSRGGLSSLSGCGCSCKSGLRNDLLIINITNVQ